MGYPNVQEHGTVLIIIALSIANCLSQVPAFEVSNQDDNEIFLATSSTTAESELFCSFKTKHLNKSMFHYDTCVGCYSYMPADFFHPNRKLIYNNSYLGCLYDVENMARYCFGNTKDLSNITATFVNKKSIRLWHDCCEAATACCEKMHRTDVTSSAAHLHCPRQWDGWACIEDTLAGQVAKVTCPSYIYFYGDPPPESCPTYGSKVCNSNGTWLQKTDYITCGQEETLRRRIFVNIAAFAVSVVFLIPAVIIFLSYKQLRVPRITMHTNLFVSLILNGIIVIIYKSVIGLNTLEKGSFDIISTNSASCKFALALTKYTRMTTYMWMFCEGFYLHKLIVAAFAEQKRLTIYYIIGWVFPIFPVMAFALMRKFLDDNGCWMLPGGYEWIINAPMVISLALNLAFLCNIIRVLITKLQATHSNEPSQYRKAVRAVLVLVPLFGLHFLLTISLPNAGHCIAIDLYYYFGHLIDGLQGFIVSLIFCYFNGEVMNLLKRSYNRHRLMSDPRGRFLNSKTSASTQNISITDLSNNGRNAIPLK